MPSSFRDTTVIFTLLYSNFWDGGPQKKREREANRKIKYA